MGQIDAGNINNGRSSDRDSDSLARGDVIGATLNLIPMIGDVVSGLCRFSGRGRRVYSSAKARYPNMTDVTDKIDEKKKYLSKLRTDVPVADVDSNPSFTGNYYLEKRVYCYLLMMT